MKKKNKALDEDLVGKDLGEVKGNGGRNHGQNTFYIYIKYS